MATMPVSTFTTEIFKTRSNLKLNIPSREIARGLFRSLVIFHPFYTQAIAIGMGAKTPFFSYFASAHVRQHLDIPSTMMMETY